MNSGRCEEGGVCKERGVLDIIRRVAGGLAWCEGCCDVVHGGKLLISRRYGGGRGQEEE